MAERELIDYVRRLSLGFAPAWLTVGIGDDSAVVEVAPGVRLILTTDMVIEGVHFEPGTRSELVGRKAMARGVSDLAAMAARPLCTLAATSFGPGWDPSACKGVIEALWRTASEFSAPLIGGDVASSPGATTITVTAAGTPGPRGAVTRSGAQPGDAVCVTGRLGGSRLGHHLTFRPRVREALELAARADVHAMIDISDGLSTDALHVAESSGVGVLLNAADLPVSPDAVTVAKQTGRDPVWHALNDGEDYELLFCVPAPEARRLADEGVAGVAVTIIGEVVTDQPSRLRSPDGREEPLSPGGWEHKV